MSKRPAAAPAHAAPAVRRSGTVAIVGRSNVGKSTLLNAALAMPLAIVSPAPQTTRERLLGVVRHGDAEIGFYDTPGLHRAQTALGRSMNRQAREALREADVVVVVTNVGERTRRDPTPPEGDLRILAGVPEGKPIVLVVNMIDKLRSKDALLPLLQGYAAAREVAAVVPISALRVDGVERVLAEVAALLPEGESRFAEDEITDRPLTYFAAEYVREPIMAATREEVPHAVAVHVELFEEPLEAKQAVHIRATIHVERPGQKKIIIGSGGEMLKRIGTEARRRIEELIGRRVHLELWVHVTPQWRERPDELAALGYEPPPRQAKPSPRRKDRGPTRSDSAEVEAVAAPADHEPPELGAPPDDAGDWGGRAGRTAAPRPGGGRSTTRAKKAGGRGEKPGKATGGRAKTGKTTGGRAKTGKATGGRAKTGKAPGTREGSGQRPWGGHDRAAKQGRGGRAKTATRRERGQVAGRKTTRGGG